MCIHLKEMVVLQDFISLDKDKIPEGPTEYFKGQDDKNLKWTVTITTSSGTVDMSEKFIINNKIYPNIINLSRC